jgi:hypothetical protein
MIDSVDVFAATFAALYTGHHVGDYWVQTDHQARTKGVRGQEGRTACLRHVGSYVATQGASLAAVVACTGLRPSWVSVGGALAVSGVTHYLADRREHGLMFWVIRAVDRVAGKATFARLGVPRSGRDDNPSLGTGVWALDQAWHILFGVFVPALVMASDALL